MKIKTDFVTNSSSSSFVVIGIHLDLEKIDIERFQRIKQKVSVTIEQMMEDPYEYLDPMLRGSDLQYSSGCEYGNGMMVGIPYTNMEEDETLQEFRQRVKDLIKEKFGIDETPSHIEECWMDN
jgi:hypothetical protein